VLPPAPAPAFSCLFASAALIFFLGVAAGGCGGEGAAFAWRGGPLLPPALPSGVIGCCSWSWCLWRHAASSISENIWLFFRDMNTCLAWSSSDIACRDQGNIASGLMQYNVKENNDICGHALMHTSLKGTVFWLFIVIALWNTM
jgi:hypothetical protein